MQPWVEIEGKQEEMRLAEPEARTMWQELNHCRGCLAEAMLMREGHLKEQEPQRGHRGCPRVRGKEEGIPTSWPLPSFCPAISLQWPPPLNADGSLLIWEPKKCRLQGPSSLWLRAEHNRGRARNKSEDRWTHDRHNGPIRGVKTRRGHSQTACGHPSSTMKCQGTSHLCLHIAECAKELSSLERFYCVCFSLAPLSWESEVLLPPGPAWADSIAVQAEWAGRECSCVAVKAEGTVQGRACPWKPALVRREGGPFMLNLTTTTLQETVLTK